MTLSCLLIQQPYASLIAFGRKRWEFRSYDTKRRGLIGIAASPSSVLSTRSAELNKISHMFPRGIVLATAELVNCFFVTYSDLKKQARSLVRVDLHGQEVTTLDSPIGEPETDVEEASNDRSWRSFAWELGNVKSLDVPIPIVRSSRSIWANVDLARAGEVH